MKPQENCESASLVPIGRGHLVPLAPANPLVSRGLSELANIQELPEKRSLPASIAALVTKSRAQIAQGRQNLQKFLAQQHGRHPFDLPPQPEYQQALQQPRC